MVRIILIKLLLLAVCGFAVGQYCASNLCPNGARHIACGNNGRFANSCPSNARMVNLRPHRSFILNLFNTRRNLIASGRLRGYRPAARMATMQWNNELARLAALNVRQCRMLHDRCRNTRQFANSGQNLASFSYSGRVNRLRLRFLIRNRINAWWNEFRNANMNIIRSYPRAYSGPAIGHFTVFVNERNIRVGCAASRYRIGQRNNFLIACNFATTNILGTRIYQPGTAASGCRTGRNRNLNSLCSTAERYAGLN